MGMAAAYVPGRWVAALTLREGKGFIGVTFLAFLGRFRGFLFALFDLVV
jgi:hypothetical protein